MFIKCIFLLSVISVLDAQYRISRSCTIPQIPNGRARSRMRSKMVRYICSPGYTLSGNRYASCRNGEWDNPVPICIRPGCVLPPEVKNVRMMPSFNEAWLVFFCVPGHQLVGSPAIYCDGRHWNATAPTCIDSTSISNLSCNFETPDLCGWKQDALHDFDWERLNKKTPSSFLLTGPPYDHTYGQGGSGYYMYIESSSRMENDTARLLSPIYAADLTNDGCFTFFYHMFGRHIGGLRVYQKPDSIRLEVMLNLPESERQHYQLFEQWGNQGDTWFGEVAPLKNISEPFQIVIEGIRGKKFTSDIAIDDVAILQGENCTAASREVTTPAVLLPDSCEGRCTNSSEPQLGCGCHLTCLLLENNSCCPDFMETCIYNSDYSTDDPDLNNTTVALPQTQKLVKTTTPSPTPKIIPISNIIGTTTTTVAPTTTKITTTPKPTSPATQKLTAKPSTTKMKLTTPKVIFQKDAIKDNSTEKPTILKVTNITASIITTKPIPKTTKAITSTKKTTVAFKPTTKAVVKKLTTAAPRVTKAAKTKGLFSETKRPEDERSADGKNGTAWKTILLTALALVCCAGVTWVVVGSRGARGRAALDYLRGRTRHDPEVRYLHSSADDDNE